MIRTIIKIEGMMCGMCEAHINDAIRAAFPVKEVSSSVGRVRRSSCRMRRWMRRNSGKLSMPQDMPLFPSLRRLQRRRAFSLGCSANKEAV